MKIIKKLLKYNKEDSLIRDGIILFSATMVLNILNYFYHFYMGRVLGPASYGILGAIFSLLYLINVPVNVVQTTLAKFTAQYKAEKKEGMINDLFRRSLRKMALYGVGGLVAFLIISPFLGEFLHIPLTPLIVFAPILVFSLVLPVSRGILQGFQLFKSLGLNLIFEGVIKLLLGIALVMVGLNVSGAVAGIVLAFLFAFLIAFKPLKKFIGKTKDRVEKKDIYKYAFPVLLALLFLTAFYTIDVLLVKHYFSELEAGYYAAVALIGKIIFFATFAIGNVMFPKVAEQHSLKKDNVHLLNKSLGFMAIASVGAVAVYFIFPKLIVLLLFGQDYLPVVPLVGWMGIIMALFSLSYLLALYNLSIERMKFIYLLAIFLIAEIILIVAYHNTLVQVVQILAGLMTVLFLSLLAYTRRT